MESEFGNDGVVEENELDYSEQVDPDLTNQLRNEELKVFSQKMENSLAQEYGNLENQYMELKAEFIDTKEMVYTIGIDILLFVYLYPE